MTTTPCSLGAARYIDAYALPANPAAGARHLQFGMGRQAVQTPPAVGRIFPHGWSTTDGSPMSIGVPVLPFLPSREPRSGWLADALRALAEVDEEIAEDGLPDISASARSEANRIIVALARHPRAPTVYPTQDGEIAIHFGSRDRPSSVIILLDRHGRGECYAYTGGRSRRAHYDAASDLPDGFVMEQLRALAPERMTHLSTQAGLGASAMTLLGGVPSGL